MAFIDIHTNNLSQELRNASTYVDNWAYVPGTAITGDWKRPYAITSLDDFKNQFGTRGPEGSITYEYVTGLLSAGIPVIFRRIACTNQDTTNEELGAKKAQTELPCTSTDSEEEISGVRITEKYGGTYGNDINITIRNTGIAYWMDVYLKNTLLERQKLINVTTDDTQLEINQKLIDAFKTVEFERIDVEVLEEDASKFNLKAVSQRYLTLGEDFDENLVKAEIPQSYNYIKDRILFQPKFITSGGYTDDFTKSDTPISTAMKDLTYIRQDCRALIDLPLGTAPEEQQTYAGMVGYQQLSSDTQIPSASICAPWQYMQVGTSQLWMPPSYVYLVTVGNDLSKGGTVYTPKAGIATGQVANIIKSEFEIGSDLAEQWQSDTAVNINPIMRLQSGSYVIAGNSTLLITDSNTGEINAFSESSADLAIIEIRRFVYNLATELQYQYNSTTAFETFSLRTAKFLEKMISENAVTDYSIANVSSNNEPRTLKVQLDVYLTPTIKKIEIYLNVSYGNIEVSTGGEA